MPDPTRSSAASASTTVGDVRVRPAVLADAEGVAALFAACEGGTLEEHRAGFETEVGRARPDNLVLVAEREGRIVGFARARFLSAADARPRPDAPAGWYLLGVLVAPGLRRRGIGSALTRARLRWIAARAGGAFYSTRAENHASLALHGRFGFVRLLRGPGADGGEPGGGGDPLLFRVRLEPEPLPATEPQEPDAAAGR